jgi:solute carrier family 29 (equilibrative nucleoside transporter), member 1/2/3
MASYIGDMSSHNMAYAIMVLQGLGNLFPWHSFITAAHYFSMRFCGSAFESNFENFFSVGANLSQTIGLLLSIHYLQQYPIKHRVLLPLLICAGIMILTTVLVTTTVSAVSLFIIALISCCIIGLSSAVSGGGLFGLGGMLPPEFTGALMTGQATGGFAVSIASLLTIWLGPGNDICSDDDTDDSSCDEPIDYSALAFFCIACIVLGACVMTFLAMISLPFTRQVSRNFIVSLHSHIHVASLSSAYSNIWVVV